MPDRPNTDLPRRERTPPEELRDWEAIQQNADDKTERLRIDDGWLYRTSTLAGVALVFVPLADRLKKIIESEVSS